jgi:hypothetical protein
MPRAAAPKKDKVERAIDEATVAEEPVPADPTPTPEVAALIPRAPQPTDPEWQDHVMSQFAPGELDPEGNPGAEACRVVAERLLGTIVSETVRTVQVPTQENDYRATVEVSVSIAWGGDPGDIRTFEDVADVYPLNMDPKFARFPTASAKTKALGRAYKSALKLRKVYTSEEMATKEVPVPEGGFEALINHSQCRFLEKTCRDLRIDLMKFVNMGERKYKDILQIPYARADKMTKVLAEYQRSGVVPEHIRGAKPDEPESQVPPQ